jgi:hypothetical protein
MLIPRALPRLWPSLLPAHQQQLARHWALLLRRLRVTIRPLQEKPHADHAIR